MTSAEKQHCSGVSDEVRAAFMENGRAMPVLRARSGAVDAIVLETFGEALAASMEEGVALVAVGGYGRRELFPCADIDLLILVNRPLEMPSAREALAHFLRVLWDRGLRVSQSVRTVEECSKFHEGNFELTVSLLDERFLGGDAALYGRLRDRFGRFLQAERRDTIRRLCRLTRSRHARFGGTIYRLEPDIKESPGGLRDYQTIRWLAGLRQAAAWDDPYPAEFIFSARCLLHFLAARDSNVLSFEAQDAVAEAPFSNWRDPADWMRVYYRHAAAIHAAALLELEAGESADRSLLASFRDWRSRLSNADFTVSRDLLFLKNPSELEVDSTLPLRLFEFVARHGIHPARQTQERLVAHSQRWQPRFAAHPPQADFWRDLLQHEHCVDALRVMSGSGFLAAVIPEWGRIDHLVVRDFYHHYTVDEHTMVALGVLERLRDSKTGPEKRIRELIDESAGQLWLLRLALLLHDVGKGSGQDHASESLSIARRFLARIGAEVFDARVVEFLIENHLLISQALQSRDLHDPATASWLASQVKTAEILRLLTILTYADISAVNPGAMTPWRAEQIVSVYHGVHRRLLGTLAPNGTTAEEVYGDLTPEMREFLAGLPARYLWTHDRAEVESHVLLFAEARRAGVAIDIERRAGNWRLTIVTADRPFLLASLSGALASFGLNILKAGAFTNAAGYAVDNFTFADPARTLELNPPEVERLRRLIARVAVGEARVEDLLKNRPERKAPSRSGRIEPRVSVDAEASSSATLCEVIAQDRTGLLYSLTSAISRAGCNIEVVLVDTEAHKAIDVFHVTKDARKLDASEASALRQAVLDACR